MNFHLKTISKFLEVAFKLLLIFFVISLACYTLRPLWVLQNFYSPPSNPLNDGNSLSWNPTSWGAGKVSAPILLNSTIDGTDELVLTPFQIESGGSACAELISKFSFERNWSSMNFLSFYADNSNGDSVIVLIRAPDLDNSWTFKITPSVNEQEFIVYFADISINAGSPSWGNVTAVSLIFDDVGSWMVGDFSVGNDFFYWQHLIVQNNLTLTIKFLIVLIIVVYPITLLSRRHMDRLKVQ